jgi:hypothetical protein
LARSYIQNAGGDDKSYVVDFKGGRRFGEPQLRGGGSNKSNLGGVLQTNTIHIATCGTG